MYKAIGQKKYTMLVSTVSGKKIRGEFVFYK